MNETNQLQKMDGGAVQQSHSESYGLAEVLNQKKLINSLLKQAMVKDTHYGAIPGCGDKFALLKPGAETIGFTFRLAPEYSIERRDLPNGHMEVQIVCKLRNISSGQVWGEGVGSCSSMENKFRFQTKSTGKAVPEDYWRSRDKELLGGPQYAPKKVGGGYVIFETIETENPAEKFNTILKIGKKRAHIDAILTATAASDCFVQDLEIDELGEDQGVMPTEAEAPQTPSNTPPRQNTTRTAKAAPEPSQGAKQGASEGGFQGDWREVVVHWGQVKGTKLGDMPKNKLWYYATKWDCQRDTSGKIRNPLDATMKAAAIAGFEELEKAEKEQQGERDDIPM